MTQGKIERYHRSMKNVVKLEHYYSPWELERAIGRFVEHYNTAGMHEALAKRDTGRMFTTAAKRRSCSRRERIKQRTLQRRKRENLQTPHHAAIRLEMSLQSSAEVSNLV